MIQSIILAMILVSVTNERGDRMKQFYVRVPYWTGPLVVSALDKKEALKRFKREQGFLRMPKGFGIWEIEQ